MSIHPRSLAIEEERPSPAVWRCSEHGDLPPGTVECEACEDEDDGDDGSWECAPFGPFG